MKIVKVKISDIDKNEANRRAVNEEKVKELAESIKNQGLINPISITSKNKLIAGYHRLKAHELLGMDEIDSIVFDVDELQAELIEIDENLMRQELTVLEQSIHFEKRDKLLEKMGQRAKIGDNQHKSGSANSAPPPKTTKEIAKEAGISERTLQERKQIAKSIPEEIQEQIKDLPIADNRTALLKLAQKKPEEQKQIAAKIISGETKNVNFASGVKNNDNRTTKPNTIQPKFNTDINKYIISNVSAVKVIRIDADGKEETDISELHGTILIRNERQYMITVNKSLTTNAEQTHKPVIPVEEIEGQEKSKEIQEYPGEQDKEDKVEIEETGASEQKQNKDEAKYEYDDNAAENEKTENFDVLYNNANTLYKEKKYNEALTLVKQLLKIRADDPSLWNFKGNILRKLKQNDQALECFDKAISINNTTPIFYGNKGLLLYNIKKYQEASECFKEYLSLELENIKACTLLYKCLSILHKYDEAVVWCNKVLELQPENDEIKKLKGEAEEKKQQII